MIRRNIYKKGSDIMELNWSLKEIYEGFESNEFTTDLETLDRIIKDINCMGGLFTKR